MPVGQTPVGEVIQWSRTLDYSTKEGLPESEVRKMSEPPLNTT